VARFDSGGGGSGDTSEPDEDPPESDSSSPDPEPEPEPEPRDPVGSGPTAGDGGGGGTDDGGDDGTEDTDSTPRNPTGSGPTAGGGGEGTAERDGETDDATQDPAPTPDPESTDRTEDIRDETVRSNQSISFGTTGMGTSGTEQSRIRERTPRANEGVSFGTTGMGTSGTEQSQDRGQTPRDNQSVSLGTTGVGTARTTREQAARDRVEQQLEEEGVDPDSVDITIEEGQDGRLQADVEPTDEEQFGDIDWSFGFGGPEDEVEQFVDEQLGDEGSEWVDENVSDPLRGVADAAGESDLLAHGPGMVPLGPVGDAVAREAGVDQNTGEAVETYLDVTANAAEDAPRLPGAVLELTEVNKYLAQPVLQGDLPEASQRTADVAVAGGELALQEGERAFENPNRALAEIGLGVATGRAGIAARRAASGTGALDDAAGVGASRSRVSSVTPDGGRFRSAVARARDRTPSLSLERAPDSPTLQIDPGLRAAIRDRLSPDTAPYLGQRPGRDLGRPLSTDLGEEAISTRVNNALRETESGTDLGRPLSTDVGETAVSTRVAEALADTDNVDLGRPLSTDLGARPLSSRVSTELQSLRFGVAERFGRPRSGPELGGPLSTSLGVPGVSSRVISSFRRPDNVDMGRPLSTDLGEEAISTRVNNALRGTESGTDLGRPLSTDVGETAVSTRVAEALADTDNVDLGRPLSTDLDTDGFTARASREYQSLRFGLSERIRGTDDLGLRSLSIQIGGRRGRLGTPDGEDALQGTTFEELFPDTDDSTKNLLDDADDGVDDGAGTGLDSDADDVSGESMFDDSDAPSRGQGTRSRVGSRSRDQQAVWRDRDRDTPPADNPRATGGGAAGAAGTMGLVTLFNNIEDAADVGVGEDAFSAPGSSDTFGTDTGVSSPQDLGNDIGAGTPTDIDVGVGTPTDIDARVGTPTDVDVVGDTQFSFDQTLDQPQNRLFDDPARQRGRSRPRLPFPDLGGDEEDEFRFAGFESDSEVFDTGVTQNIDEVLESTEDAADDVFDDA